MEWAQVRASAADGVSAREIAERLGINLRMARLARSEEPPRYRRAPEKSKPDPFEQVLRRLLEEWPQIKRRSTREPPGREGSAMRHAELAVSGAIVLPSYRYDR